MTQTPHRKTTNPKNCWDCGAYVEPNEDDLVPVGPFGVACWTCWGTPTFRRKLSEPLTDVLNNGGLRGGGGVEVLYPRQS